MAEALEYTDEDMAAVGRDLMDSLRINADSLNGWHPCDTPAEIVTDLLNERDELRAQLAEAQASERERCAKVCERQADHWRSAGDEMGEECANASSLCAVALSEVALRIRALSPTPNQGKPE